MPTQTHLKVLAIAAAMLGIPVVAQAQYGFDLVPDTVFHSGKWVQYGSDMVPGSTTLQQGLPTGYGFDRVPDGAHPHTAQRSHRH